jgi:hypothetical protein
MKTAFIHKLHACSLHRTVSLFVVAVSLVLAMPTSRADNSKVHALAGFEFSDKYLTPRGMIVQNQGLTFQLLTLALVNLHKSDGFLSDVTFVGGFWNDYATSPLPKHLKSPGATNWIEIDPIAGLSFSFAKNFKLDVTYTAFAMQILDIGTSQHLETKLSFNDTDYLGSWALHPYLLYWKELDGKSTAAANFGFTESYYFEIGVAPAYTAGKWKLEAPLRVLLPDSDFYGNHFAEPSTVGLYEIGVKASTSAGFMPVGYGNWSMHVGVRYMNFTDDNLKHLANGGGFGAPTDDVWQIYAGLNSFF